MSGNVGGLSKDMLNYEWTKQWETWVCQEQASCATAEQEKGEVCFTFSKMYRVYVPWGYKNELNLLKMRCPDMTGCLGKSNELR